LHVVTLKEFDGLLLEAAAGMLWCSAKFVPRDGLFLCGDFQSPRGLQTTAPIFHGLRKAPPVAIGNRPTGLNKDVPGFGLEHTRITKRKTAFTRNLTCGIIHSWLLPPALRGCGH
jgi:hypothetical protein